jgi:hypothetical protein
MRRTADSDMITTYLESFNRIWTGAQPLDWDRSIEGKL